MPSKRYADWDNEDVAFASPSKRARVTSSNNTAKSCVRPVHPSFPRTCYKPHPDSGVGKDFHSVPYPLILLTKKSWESLNRGESNGAVCASCGKPRPSTIHQRKLLLVAERLSWDVVSYAARSQNEVSLWAVNAELDIYEPAVDDEDVVIGGRNSRKEGEWYPYRGREEALMAMRIVAEAEILSEGSWQLWRTMADVAVNLAAYETPKELVDLTGDNHVTKARIDPAMGFSGRPALQDISPNSDLRRSGPSSGDNSKSAVRGAALSKKPDSSEADANVLKSKVRCSYQTLPEFYTLLDKIERTSSMGARYLDAYAERLHTETCKDCWFERNIVNELLQEAPEPEPEPKSQPGPKSVRQSHTSPYPGRRTQPPVQRPSPPTAAPSYITVGPPIRQTAPNSQVRPSQVGGAPQASNIPPHPLASAFQNLAAGQGAVVLPDLPESPAVMNLLALWAQIDQNLAQLFEAFAKRTATAEQERIFNFYVTAARYRIVATPQPQSVPQPQVSSVRGPTFGHSQAQPFIGSKSRPR